MCKTVPHGQMTARERSPRGNQMRISAIVPLYNGAPFIEAALRSIAGQRRQADEIVVVDDGSTDGGDDIVRRLGSELPLRIISKMNGGQGSARNVGVRASTGDLIAFLDQDDIWYPQHLEELERPFLNRPSLGCSYSDLDQMDVNGQPFSGSVHETYDANAPHPKRTLLDCISRDMFMLPGASLVARGAFEAVGGFDESLIGYEDDDFFLRLFAAGYDAVYVPKALTQWRIFPGSASRSIKMARSRLLYFDKLAKLFPDDVATGQYFVRDALVPRFLPNVAGDAVRCLTRAEDDFRLVALEALQRLLPHCMGSSRIQMRILALALNSKVLVGVMRNAAIRRAIFEAAKVLGFKSLASR
ncbi:glycosyltransferase family A protein [Bradyrhizobium sp. LHD-71]|uniref:glycosyltransferase family 2 protein n=1 Tax=Bradyrhizobium sp. LHD-71 TaxID=3072141 RepID=UPI00280E0498|nr:glycosyltransferase family A protein [Bradyrhizobium sp. LHD-71]MDQ8731404.1 glycosyltransferase family A protein [Bradyrhizobium sp. LHD-71]